MSLISVIVPIYNSEPYLEKCLSSIKNQTYSNIEIIMIDDGSVDCSSSICEKYLKDDQRFVYIRQDNAGVSAARNHGLRIAKGDYIGFCDSDDWLEPDMYEVLYNMIEKTDADVSVISFTFNELIDSRDYKFQEKQLEVFDSERAIVEMCHGAKFQGHLCNKLIKRELLTDIFLREDIAIYEDMLMMCTIFDRCKKVVFCDLPKYHYVIVPNSAMNSVLKESYWSIQLACRDMIDYMEYHHSKYLHYAQKIAVWGNMTIAEKAFACKSLTRKNYKKIKSEIIANYSKNCQALLNFSQRTKIRAFLMGRVAYVSLMSCIKVLKQVRILK